MTWISKWIGIVGRLILVCVSLVSLVSLSACESMVTVSDLDRAYGIVRAAVKESMPGGVRKISENGREFDSNYFAPKGPFDVDGSTGIYRETARVTILGAGRPYSIRIEAIVEKKEGRKYEDVGRDTVRAKELAQRIRTGLSNRRDDRNVIDDFKPF